MWTKNLMSYIWMKRLLKKLRICQIWFKFQLKKKSYSIVIKILINDCLNIEQNINEINKRNLNLKEFKLIEYKIEFILNEKESIFFEKI